MLQIYLKHVLDLKDLAHPGRTDVHSRQFIIARIMHLSLTKTSILSHNRSGRSINDVALSFYALVIFKFGDKKLKVLLLSCLGFAARLLDSLDTFLMSIEKASQALTAA